MGHVTKQVIIKYDIPIIGIYEVDEGMVCYLNNEEFAYAKSVDDAKDNIRSSVAEQVKAKLQEIESNRATLTSINVGLIDENYRNNTLNS